MIVATHNGNHHADDVMAVAILQLVFGEIEIIRTRDKTIYDQADAVVDVGGVYDEDALRFDHHQRGGAGVRAHARPAARVPYAACGLVWKKYGATLCSSTDVARLVDYCLISPLDANDTGFSAPSGFAVSLALAQFNLNWDEDPTEETQFEAFLEAVSFAKRILVRTIRAKEAVIKAKQEVLDTHQPLFGGAAILLDKALPWQGIVGRTMPDCLYVIVPGLDGRWLLQTVSGLTRFSRRKDLPAHWAGLNDQDFVDATQVADASFCHTGLFIAGAHSKEGALALAKLAIEA